MNGGIQDAAVRKAAFAWLEMQVAVHGDVLPRALLAEGFRYEDRRVPLVSAQGIFKPAVCALPLTITTAPNGPYEDRFEDDHRLLYRYRGTDPAHRDNMGLREAMRLKVPLIYLLGLVPGQYLTVWPVFVAADDPEQLSFTIMADDQQSITDVVHDVQSDDIRRRYVTRDVIVRMHQRSFRERVLRAYREQCALCRLRHRELLDASHIIPDKEKGGEPRVSNGLALCKIHHTAFDRHFIGIRPDAVIQVRRDILEEEDGPMLQHGLKAMHGLHVRMPRRRQDQPDQDALAVRYERFLEVQG